MKKKLTMKKKKKKETATMSVARTSVSYQNQKSNETSLFLIKLSDWYSSEIFLFTENDDH